MTGSTSAGIVEREVRDRPAPFAGGFFAFGRGQRRSGSGERGRSGLRKLENHIRLRFYQAWIA